MNTKVINIEPTADYRIIAISDIHGHGDLLRKLLQKVRLNPEDFLIIIGDFINKGVDSLDALNYVRELSKRQHTIILKGNHEYFIHYHMESLSRFKKLYKIVTREGFETLIHALCGNRCDELKNNIEEVYKCLIEKNQQEFEFIKNLPIIANIGKFRFVHGGYLSHYNVTDNEVDYLKFDDYNTYSEVNDKMTIVGHWPLCNLRYDRIDNRPYFNHEKNIVFIDGAIGVKSFGELNAFIIENKSGVISYDCIQENEFKRAKIIKTHIFDNRDEKIYVNYPHYDFEVIEKGEHMTLCKHTYSGKQFRVFNGLLEEDGDKYHLITNFVNNYINVKVGEEVDICHIYKDCALVKYNHEFGWLYRNQIEK